MRAYGGISVVNALPSWYGSSMAIDLKVDVSIEPGKYKGDSSLIKEIVRFINEKYGINFDVKINSEIPQKSGLKGSSAVSVALLAEVSKKYDIQIDIPKMSAILSIKAGVSFTGALDDAISSYFGGISYTYNKGFEVIGKANPPKDIAILVLPQGNRPNFNPWAFRNYSTLFREFFRISLNDPLKAMRLNGIAVGEILGYSMNIVDELLRKGALAAGISGNGPSYFAVTKEGDEGPVIEVLNTMGKVIVTRAVTLEG
ncbi:shikimate kinase [Candidatus Acidianus copahuensis]|uniref:Shikimate kinase n=1 Tax=Candidatus Acidianus copahuensis TaxID=1160895 RepID=A0A031LRD6_9CREN|nr:shikimate kinase [Candidatus Acidianus copahuensis]EZQ06964.1 shikimate kinase [Candidatus Acidianus copahuensis]